MLITGANVGIGKDVARQLALRPEIGRIYLACRNQDRASTAKADLEAVTGRHIFDIILMDVADLGSVRAGLAAISGSLDALVMNAGVIGNKTLMELTADGVTKLFATNVLGHAVLLEGLLTQNRLSEVAVFAASEAARGIPKLGFKRPTFVSTSTDELTTVIDGSYFADRKYDQNLAFGQVKYIGALWMAHLARQYPDLRFITVSPGNTTGTEAAAGAAPPLRFAAKHIMPRLGISHELDVGSKRLVDGVTDPKLLSGVFYASAAGKLKGPMVDQADIFPDLANPSFQDHANEAIHRFITEWSEPSTQPSDRVFRRAQQPLSNPSDSVLSEETEKLNNWVPERPNPSGSRFHGPKTTPQLTYIFATIWDLPGPPEKHPEAPTDQKMGSLDPSERTFWG